TDTSSLFYHEDALQEISVLPPTDIKESWTFDQFGVICDKLLKAGKQQFAFTENQGGGRWVPSYLYATGGKLVTPDFSKIAINSPEGIRALTWVKSWFDRKWTPTDVWMVWITSRPNGDTDPFVRGEASMGMLGLWNITYLDENIKDRFKWNVTFEPRDKVQSTSMGGTPIVAWGKTQHPDETTAFMSFFVSPEMMRMFDEMGNYLPTRLDLSKLHLNYHTRPDLVPTFQEQDQYLPVDYVSYVARSYSSGIGTIVNEETTKMTTQGQSPEVTAKNIETRGNKYIVENPDPEMK
ncbi:MAG: ABC transporter substrate-binding protein, partial [Candidatus Dormibacteraceae bacterium]